jgi:hypothetical protein
MKLLIPVLAVIIYNIYTTPYYTCSINDAPNNTLGFTEDPTLLNPVFALTLYKSSTPSPSPIPLYTKVAATISIISYLIYDIFWQSNQ